MESPNYVEPTVQWKDYRKKGITNCRPYEDGELLSSAVSISEADRENGSPKVGDMIARNPNDHNDQWLIAGEYFQNNYIEA